MTKFATVKKLVTSKRKQREVAFCESIDLKIAETMMPDIGKMSHASF